MTASAPFFAGFESARLHWNGHDTLPATGHLPQLRMAQNIEREAMVNGNSRRID